jgi:hypothetical protein
MGSDTNLPASTAPADRPTMRRLKDQCVHGSRAHEAALVVEGFSARGEPCVYRVTGATPIALHETDSPPGGARFGVTDEALAAIVIDRLRFTRDNKAATAEQRKWAGTAVTHFEVGLEQIKSLTRVRLEEARDAAEKAKAEAPPAPEPAAAPSTTAEPDAPAAASTGGGH